MDFIMSGSLAYFLHNVIIKVTIAPNFISHNKKDDTEESVLV